jgi:hypothetical protein
LFIYKVGFIIKKDIETIVCAAMAFSKRIIPQGCYSIVWLIRGIFITDQANFITLSPHSHNIRELVVVGGAHEMGAPTNFFHKKSKFSDYQVNLTLAKLIKKQIESNWQIIQRCCLYKQDSIKGDLPA